MIKIIETSVNSIKKAISVHDILCTQCWSVISYHQTIELYGRFFVRYCVSVRYLTKIYINN